MIFIKPLAQKVLLLGLLLFSFTIINAQGGAVAEGKTLFQQNCQSCHALDKALTGPALRGFVNRGPWGDREEIYKWVKNPAAYMAADPYTKGLQQQFGAIMTPFPQLTTDQIDAIVEYTNSAPEVNAAAGGGDIPATGTDN